MTRRASRDAHTRTGKRDEVPGNCNSDGAVSGGLESPRVLTQSTPQLPRAPRSDGVFARVCSVTVCAHRHARRSLRASAEPVVVPSWDVLGR